MRIIPASARQCMHQAWDVRSVRFCAACGSHDSGLAASIVPTRIVVTAKRRKLRDQQQIDARLRLAADRPFAADDPATLQQVLL